MSRSAWAISLALIGALAAAVFALDDFRCGGLEGQPCLESSTCSGPGPECLCVGAVIPSPEEILEGAPIVPGMCRALFPLPEEPEEEPEEPEEPEPPEDPPGIITSPPAVDA